jgi:cytochrome P450
VLFGGISTVEALILNSLWALFMHPETLERVRGDPSLFPAVIDETIRWLNPVQSAGTHACLGLHLAKLEARIAVEDLVRELPDLRLIDPVASTPRGYEFRQPRAMPVMWETDDSKGPT